MTTDTLNAPNPRRRKIFIVPYEIAFQILFPTTQLPGKIEVACPLNVPPTAKLVSVHEDYARISFGFVVQDDSFAEVALGCQMEQVLVDWQVILLDRAKATSPEDPAQQKLGLD